jgi:hypothetical protein
METDKITIMTGQKGCGKSERIRQELGMSIKDFEKLREPRLR